MGAFDDDIKRRAGDFRPEPREGVWDRIEQELEEKKRRRPLVWLWWMMPLMLAGGSGLLWNNQLKDPGNEQRIQSKSTVEIPSGNTVSAKEENPTADTEMTENDVKNEDDITINENKHTPVHTRPHTATAKAYPDAGSLPAKQLINRKDSQKKESFTQEETNHPPAFEESKEIPMMAGVAETTKSNLDSATNRTNEPASIIVTKEESDLTGFDNLVNDSVKIESNPTEAQSAAPSPEKPTPPKKSGKPNTKGSWNLVAGVGIHNIGGQQLSLSSSAAEFNNRLSTGNNTTGGGFSNTPNTLAPPKAGPGILLGIERQQPLGIKNRWSLNAGLHYQYQTVSISTGAKKDSVLTGVPGQTAYYLPGNSIKHTGKQHSMHLLAAAQWHIGKKRHWTWQNGLYGGLVLSDDYLIPYASRVGWVSSEGQTATGYWGIESGIRFMPERIGVGLFGQYNLSSSVKNNFLSDQYWRGIELRILYKLPSK
jgi:hypothetical protein